VRRGRSEIEDFRDDENFRFSNHLTPRRFTETDFSNFRYRNIIQIIVKCRRALPIDTMRRRERRETALRHSAGTTIAGTAALLAAIFGAMLAASAPAFAGGAVLGALSTLAGRRAVRTLCDRRVRGRREVCRPGTDVRAEA
jgi:hypothetical protein